MGRTVRGGGRVAVQARTLRTWHSGALRQNARSNAFSHSAPKWVDVRSFRFGAAGMRDLFGNVILQSLVVFPDLT